MERREASPPIYICLALIPAGSGLPRSSTLVQRILNGSHATLTVELGRLADNSLATHANPH
ncbi:hypothetical protein AB4Y32_29665, partial [Paraburkholderia phymatum]